jgi:uncharacterized membrane protein
MLDFTEAESIRSYNAQNNAHIGKLYGPSLSTPIFALFIILRILIYITR